MEKKPVLRPVQPQNKGACTDFKRNQDASSSKWVRGSRSGSASTNKSTQSKNKLANYDKRPRPRGFGGSQMGGKSDTRLEQDEHEYGSVFKHGSKKQSLNHLLNFHYVRREPMSNGQRGYLNRTHHHHHKYNKEQYLQANCQFVVVSGEDYSVCMTDADALVNWDMIVQILVKSEEAPRCPICLEAPLAGRITRCGHIYCYPCLLHYLALSDKTWRKCPICFESVYAKDVKSVSWLPTKTFNVGDSICLQLMRRSRQSLQAVPVRLPWIPSDTSPSMLNQAPDIIQHCKLLQANTDQVLEIINRDKLDLISAIESEGNTPEACFIEQALDQLNQININIPNKKSPAVTKTLNENNIAVSEHQNMADEKLNENLQNDVSSILYNTMEHHPLSVSPNKDKNAESSCEDTTGKDFYFYQAMDGQHIYLAGLNARVLERSYGGSLSLCPPTISGTVEAKEVIFVTKDLRKRLRYLEHLPVTCQIELVELKLNPPTVTEEALDFYKNDISARRRARLQKSREENKRDKRITREQQRQFGLLPAGPAPEINLQSESHFPQCGIRTSTSESEYEYASVSSEGVDHFETNLNASPSFAKMLISKGHNKPEWPSLSTPSRSLNMLSTPTPTPEPTNSEEIDTSNSFDEEYAAAPNYTQSFSNAITQAMENVTINNEAATASKESGRKKKKKAKPRVLFATGMNLKM